MRENRRAIMSKRMIKNYFGGDIDERAIGSSFSDKIV